MAARTLNLILALWLFFSAFAFPRSAASFTNAWLIGLLAAVFALAGMRSPGARFANTTLSAWLLVSAFVLTRGGTAARWNDLVVAIVMLAVSLVPGTMYPRRHAHGHGASA
jgi:hypothetical protein